MTPPIPMPDIPARRSADLAQALDIFIDADAPCDDAPVPAIPGEGPSCAL